MNEPTPPTLRPDYQMVGPMEADLAPAATFRIQRLFPFLLRYWWLPVLMLVVFLGAAGGYVWWKPPTYVSRGSMWETVKLRLPDGALFTEDVQNFLGTQSELLQSATLRDLALARMRSSKTNVAVPLGSDGQALPVIIRVAGSAKSSVFRIEATSARSYYTQAYLNALMDVYLEFKKNVRKEVSLDTLASISAQVQRMERDLKAEQDILAAFQRTNNLVVLEEEGKAAASYLAQLNTQLSNLQMENRLLQATPTNSRPTLSGETNASPPLEASLAGAPAEHKTAFKELELLNMQREKLSRYLRPKHPKIVKLDADIQRAEKLIEIYHRQTDEQLVASRQAVQSKIANLMPTIQEWESKAVIANTLTAQGNQLKLNVSRVQSVYERLALLVQNVGISRNIDQETLAILEPASQARRSYMKELALLAGAAIGGVALGLAIIVLLALRDDRFTSFTEITEKLGAEVVCQVPEVLGAKSADSLPLLELDDERHAYAESFRSLRSALTYMTIESERPRVILVTSAQPHEGKSTVAANLARALAMGGARVVLVDADLRAGILHERMELQREPGLAEILRDPTQLDKAIQTNSMPNLAFISRGRVVGNCGDVLLGSAFDLFLAQLREQYDYVVIDSSPVFAADDATTLAPKVDGTLVVVRNRYSRAGPVREALGLLYQRNVRVLGVIFNQTDSASRSNYYYKYAEYHAAGKPA